MCKLIVLILVFSITGCAASTEGLVIEGPEEFQTTVRNALALIAEKSPGQFKDVQRLVKRIRLEETAPVEGISAWSVAPDRIFIYSKMASRPFGQVNEPLTIAFWIVHETAHLTVAEKGRTLNAETEEREALQAERVFLKALGFDDEFIDWICGEERLKGRQWENLPQ